MPRNPWTRQASRKVYETEWFSVRRDDVLRPDGQPGVYSVIEAERHALGVVPLWDDGTITLVGQHRYPLDQYSWEIPEGGGDKDADPVEEAKRELREETGLTAARWDSLGSAHLSNCFLDETCFFYLARDLTQGPDDPGGDEELTVKRVPLEEAVAMAQDGRITDAMTLVALFRLQPWLHGSSLA